MARKIDHTTKSTKYLSIKDLMFVLLVFLILAFVGYLLLQGTTIASPKSLSDTATEDRFKKVLTNEQYSVLREAGTETPYSGKLDYETRPGTYYSYGCDKPIFRSEQKYDSHTGWPSFWAPIKPDAVQLQQGTGLDDRIEVKDTCGSHLGHVFDDGPQPTGKRYCMNSVAMYFVPDKK